MFRYDGGTSFQETGDNGFVEFVRGTGMGGGIGSILYTYRPEDDYGSDRNEYYMYNAVGHTVGLLDDAAAVTHASVYDAFGNIVAESGASANNRLANTKERDAALGLDNHGFRYYDPATGRYLTRDPIGYGDGMNVYASVGNNPINHIDPLGLWQWPWSEKASWRPAGTTAVINTGASVVGGIAGAPRAAKDAVTATVATAIDAADAAVVTAGMVVGEDWRMFDSRAGAPSDSFMHTLDRTRADATNIGPIAIASPEAIAEGADIALNFPTPAGLGGAGRRPGPRQPRLPLLRPRHRPIPDARPHRLRGWDECVPVGAQQPDQSC